jgi:hypothetical protein
MRFSKSGERHCKVTKSSKDFTSQTKVRLAVVYTVKTMLAKPIPYPEDCCSRRELKKIAKLLEVDTLDVPTLKEHWYKWYAEYTKQA